MSGLWRGPHVLHLPGGRYWQQSEACRDPAENGFCNQVPSSELFKPESEESLLGRAENWVRSLPPGPEAPSGPRPSACRGLPCCHRGPHDSERNWRVL